MFNGKTVLITGGTGSFGHQFVNQVLTNFSPKKLIVLSRDEMKQWHMKKAYADNESVRFLIGDVRDRPPLQSFQWCRLYYSRSGHKIVPTAEYEPFDASKLIFLGP